MISQKFDIRMRLYLAAALLLLAGLGTAAFIFFTSQSEKDTFGYDTATGYISKMDPWDSKVYRHDLELFGGSAIVLADDFRRWFESLWQGKSLAVTLACITILISVALFFIANRLPLAPNSGITGEDSEIRKN